VGPIAAALAVQGWIVRAYVVVRLLALIVSAGEGATLRPDGVLIAKPLLVCQGRLLILNRRPTPGRG